MIDSEENYEVTESAPCTGTIQAALEKRGKDQVCAQQGMTVNDYKVQQPMLSVGGLRGGQNGSEGLCPQESSVLQESSRYILE